MVLRIHGMDEVGVRFPIGPKIWQIYLSLLICQYVSVFLFFYYCLNRHSDTYPTKPASAGFVFSDLSTCFKLQKAKESEIFRALPFRETRWAPTRLKISLSFAFCPLAVIIKAYEFHQSRRIARRAVAWTRSFAENRRKRFAQPAWKIFSQRYFYK